MAEQGRGMTICFQAILRKPAPHVDSGRKESYPGVPG